MESDDIYAGPGSKGLNTASTYPVQFRIFLASPGDVPLERALVREAITHLSNERHFRGRIHLEIIAWDQPGAAVAMEAGLTPQQAITQGLTKPADCDLAVVIFWSRIGTQLPADFEVKEDGTPYLSGTEWEYHNALRAYKSTGKPAVWTFRRKGAPQFAADDPHLAENVEQWQKLQAFFATFTNADRSLAGGINDYASPDDFRLQFERFLRDHLTKLLETLPTAEATPPSAGTIDTPIWPGSPYPGLNAFTSEQAPIFFGRGAQIDQLLQQFTNPQVQFVAVVGVSGSGKSSLVKAGLLPRLRTGIVGNTPWIDLDLKPGERGGNPFMALAFALQSALDLDGQTEEELARSIQANHQLVKDYCMQLLTQHPPASELLLVIDQFEELFTLSQELERQEFIQLLEHLVTQPRLRVIVTLRADFYARAIEEPVLAHLLRRDRSTYPLDPPGMAAIHDMITGPAAAAGLELQAGLAQRLLDEAGDQGPGMMALIAYTLNQLYQQEQGNGTHNLSIAAYEKFGGVQGAVQKRAEAALQGLQIDLDTALPQLFTHLIEVNEQEIATRRRTPKAQLHGDVITAADALTEARLLVSGKGKNNQPTLEVAHETVLSGWKRLCDWILAHADLLRARRDLEYAATEWKEAGRHSSALRTGRLLQRYLGAAQPRSAQADAYLVACRRRQWIRRASYTMILGILAILATGLLGILIFLKVSGPLDIPTI